MRRWGLGWGWLPAAGFGAVLALLTLAPFARLLWQVIAAGPGPLMAVLAAPATRTAAVHSAVVALGGAAVSGVLGGAMALLVGATDVPGGKTLGALFTLLMVLPAQVTTLAWIALLGPSSPVLLPLGLAPPAGTAHPLYGPGGIALLLGVEHAPMVFLVVRGALQAIPADLLAAARGVGARPLRCLVEIVLPLAAPALRAGLALAFVASVGNFATPALLGIPGRYTTLTTLVYQRLVAFGPAALSGAAGLSVVLLALAGAGLALHGLLGGGTAVRLAGTGRATLFELGAARLPLAAVAWLALLILLAVPLAALLGTALLRAYGVALAADTVTAENFRSVLFAQAATRRALGNSLLLAASAAAILTGLAVVAGAFAVHRRSRLIAAVLTAADLAYALPGVVLALACILLFIRPVFGIRLYDTLGIILIAYLARFLTLAQRPVAAAFRRLDLRLEQAARASGAGLWLTLRLVVLPLIAPGAAAGLLLVFLTAFNELTVSALLWSSGNETIGVVLFSLEQAGETTQAAAVGVICAVIAGASVGLLGLIEKG